jgi:cellulase
MQVTPHDCDAPSAAGFYPHCDQSGCGVNTKNSAGVFGPGGSFTVDTTAPFIVSTHFAASGGQLTGITSTIAQGSRAVVLVHTDAQCGGGYLERLSSALQAGMVPALSLWGDAAGGMSWLDQPPCGGESCDPSSTASFSNIAIY